MRWRGRALIAALALATAHDAALAQATEPIPVRALFSNLDSSSPAISPSGDRIALLVSRGDLQIVAVRSLDGSRIEAVGKMDDPRVRFASLRWAKPDVLWVANERDDPFAIGTRDRAQQVFAASFADFKVRWLGFLPRVVHWLPSDPEQVLIDDWGRVQSLRARDGKLRNKPVQPRSGRIGAWHADSSGAIRAGEALVGNTLSLWARAGAKGELRQVASFDVMSERGPAFVAFHDDPSKLWVTALHAGRSALFALDIATGALGEPGFAHAEVDVSNVHGDPRTGRVLGALYVDDRPRIAFFDEAARREHELLRERIAESLGGEVEPLVTSVDDAGRFEIAEVSADTQPPAFFLHDRASGELRRLFEPHPARAFTLAATRRADYRARDGLAIRAYLTLPPGADGARRLPTIVIPHGGPSARDAIGWNPELQLFASRGYAVFQPNFRGSAGFGLAFEKAGHREWGGKMQDDVTDGVKWLIAEGIADPERIGIYGASYGGYAALVGLIQTPELFRAGAAYAAVTDLPSMLADDRWYGRYLVATNREAVGGGMRDRERLRALSPRRRAHEITRPVLLGHGEDDARVRVEHSREMRAALAKAGRDVTYLEFEHEIHGFALEANRVRWYEALVAFFEKQLAPR